MNWAEQIEKYAPGRGAQIRSNFKNVNAGNSYYRESSVANYAMANAMNTAANAMAYAANSNSGSNSNSAFEQSEKARREREKVEKQMMDDIKDLGSKPLPKEERDKIVVRARGIISETKGRDKKIVALSVLAAQVARAGNKDLADQIMLDADRLVNPQPKNYQDFLLSWMLASGYAEANPDKAFPLLEPTILRANETITAAIKVAEFIDVNEEYVVDGEVQVGMFGGSMVRELTGELGMASSTIKSLAKADFTKTKSLANSFDRTETRVLAKMLVLRAVLDKKEAAKINENMTIEGETGDGDTAPEPPIPTKPRLN